MYNHHHWIYVKKIKKVMTLKRLKKKTFSCSPANRVFLEKFFGVHNKVYINIQSFFFFLNLFVILCTCRLATHTHTHIHTNNKQEFFPTTVSVAMGVVKSFSFHGHAHCCTFLLHKIYKFQLNHLPPPHLIASKLTVPSYLPAFITQWCLN